MTREEAIKIIDCYDIGFYDLSGVKIPADKLAEAFDMAIEALTHANSRSNHDHDLISRADAIDALYAYQDAVRIIKALPSAESRVQPDYCIAYGSGVCGYPIEECAECPKHDYYKCLPDIVRCKDCRHRDLFSCPLTDNDFQKDDDFCSWGEHKGSDDE
jgi:hypothetical protein